MIVFNIELISDIINHDLSQRVVIMQDSIGGNCKTIMMAMI